MKVDEILKKTLENANPIYNLNAYGNDGASYSSNFVGNDRANHKTDLFNQIKTFSPAQIWCFMGTNDANRGHTVNAAYTKVKEFFSDFPINYLNDKTKIVLISLPYYPNGYPSGNANSFTMQDAVDINSGIKLYADEKKFRFIDIFTESCGGQLLPDKLHFVKGAYQTMVNCIVAKYLAR